MKKFLPITLFFLLWGCSVPASPGSPIQSREYISLEKSIPPVPSDWTFSSCNYGEGSMFEYCNLEFPMPSGGFDSEGYDQPYMWAAFSTGSNASSLFISSGDRNEEKLTPEDIVECKDEYSVLRERCLKKKIFVRFVVDKPGIRIMAFDQHSPLEQKKDSPYSDFVEHGYFYYIQTADHTYHLRPELFSLDDLSFIDTSILNVRLASGSTLQ